MKVLRKNQVVIFVVALMMVAAGYLNYTSQISEEVSVKQSEEGYDYAGIGDAKLVDSESIVGEENTIKETIENNISNSVETSSQENNTQANNIINGTENTVQTNSENTEDYFTSSKLQRDNMYYTYTCIIYKYYYIFKTFCFY